MYWGNEINYQEWQFRYFDGKGFISVSLTVYDFKTYKYLVNEQCCQYIARHMWLNTLNNLVEKSKSFELSKAYKGSI